MKIKAVANKVAVVMDGREEQKGGIVIPECAQNTNNLGTVVSAGPDCAVLKAGDRVHVPDHLGTHFIAGGQDHVIVEEAKIPYKVENDD